MNMMDTLNIKLMPVQRALDDQAGHPPKHMKKVTMVMSRLLVQSLTDQKSDKWNTVEQALSLFIMFSVKENKMIH